MKWERIWGKINRHPLPKPFPPSPLLLFFLLPFPLSRSPSKRIMLVGGVRFNLGATVLLRGLGPLNFSLFLFFLLFFNCLFPIGPSDGREIQGGVMPSGYLLGQKLV